MLAYDVGKNRLANSPLIVERAQFNSLTSIDHKGHFIHTAQKQFYNDCLLVKKHSERML